MKKFGRYLLLLFLIGFLAQCGSDPSNQDLIETSADENSPELLKGKSFSPDRVCQQTLYYDHLIMTPIIEGCKKATKSQLSQVNKGNAKKDKFLTQCYDQTENSCWCDQLIRPNPVSIATFHCTYGKDQVHQLINPSESTWKHAFEAVKIIQDLEDMNLQAEIIYNWWRPEPYNKNVEGSASRHPFGTSVDVRFVSKSVQNKVFSELCKMRRRGRLRAIGYYGSPSIHMGIGDRSANTWGKACP